MQHVAAWVGAHALVLLAALVALGAVGAVAHWRGRPEWSDDVPVPILRGRLAIALVALGIAGFGALALAIHAEYGIVSIDRRVTREVAEALGPTALQAMATISQFGATELVTALAVVVTGVLMVTGHKLLGGAWAFTVLGSSFLIGFSKETFERPRPLHVHGFAEETTWSFPSGHAAGAMVFYGMLAYVLLVRLPAAWHRTVLATALGVIVAIGASRVLLQVHYLSDVFAGFSLGLAWLGLCAGATEFLRTAHRRKALPASP